MKIFETKSHKKQRLLGFITQGYLSLVFSMVTGCNLAIKKHKRKKTLNHQPKGEPVLKNRDPPSICERFIKSALPNKLTEAFAL